MFKSPTREILYSSDAWSEIKIDANQQLFRLHHFFLLSGGRNYNIEIQESPTGVYSGHADNTADPHDAVAPSHGKTLQECLNNLVAEISKRGTGS